MSLASLLRTAGAALIASRPDVYARRLERESELSPPEWQPIPPSEAELRVTAEEVARAFAKIKAYLETGQCTYEFVVMDFGSHADELLVRVPRSVYGPLRWPLSLGQLWDLIQKEIPGVRRAYHDTYKYDPAYAGELLLWWRQSKI